MTEEIRYAIFNTRMGWVGILASAKGLLCTTLPQPSVQEARCQLGDKINYATESPSSFDNLIQRLQSYFNGVKVAFLDQPDFLAATPFQRKVWRATRLIPYGEIRSYAWVAEQIEKPPASRAVGQALGRNPLVIIIPCHRVLASNGTLGGFTGGVEIKRQLLQLEAASQRAAGR